MANHERNLAKERLWRSAVARQAASGLSVRAFCRREQLAESAFYAWRRTIAQRDGMTAGPVKSRRAKASTFVPVVVTAAPRRDESIVIELAGGRVLRLPASMSAAWLAELAEALEARGGR
jgi:hypothetical protein